MDRLQNWFRGDAAADGASSGGGASEEPSLLAEWHSYSSAPGAAPGQPGGSGGGGTARLLSSAEEGAAGVTRFVTQAAGVLQTTVQGATATVQAQVESAQFIPSSTQWTYFITLGGFGALFLVLAFVLFLPVLVVAPAKFALTFSVGSCLVISSLGALRGFGRLFKQLVAMERLPFSAAYVVSLLLTLYSSLFVRSYLLSLLFCAIQVVTLIYFLASFFPGGTTGAKFLMGGLGKGALSAGGALARSVVG